MHNSRLYPFRFSPVSLATSALGILAVSYIGLIAVVMGYATMTIEFSQSVKQDEASVATLESRYLAAIEQITTTDYRAAGYAKPIAEVYVPAKIVTALR